MVVSETHIEVREGGGKNYAVVLTSEPSGQVTVTPSSDDPMAASVSGALTFTTDNWNMKQWVTVIGVQDADAIDDTATITHAVAGYGPAATAAGVTVAVDDDDQPPEVTVRARSESVTEGEEAVFIFNRTGDTSYALTAEFRNIVRIGDENVSNDPAQVTFQTDSDSAEFTVATEDDNLANVQPTKYRVRVANGEGYTKGEPGTATVTATDDDEASTGFILAVAPRRVREGDGETEIVLTVALNASPRAEETLFVVSGYGSDEGEGATATTDVDFMLTPSLRTVTIPAGETSATGAFLLTLTDDNLLEGDETVVFFRGYAGKHIPGQYRVERGRDGARHDCGQRHSRRERVPLQDSRYRGPQQEVRHQAGLATYRERDGDPGERGKRSGRSVRRADLHAGRLGRGEAGDRERRPG